MNKLILFSLWALGVSLLPHSNTPSTKVNASNEQSISKPKENNPIRQLYEEMELEGLIKWEAFHQALQGYYELNPKKNDILSIIDFSLPSSEKRMYVLNIKAKKVLFHTLVAHGAKSGNKFATSFSNRNGSHQSSLGFYLAQETYYGSNGFSMRLDGLEKGINDLARQRAIVVHGADYCSWDVVKSTGRLGRSYGCPALPREVSKPIIDTIKNGSLLFIYADDPTYIAQSKVIKDAQKHLQNPSWIAQKDDQEEQNKISIN